MTKEELLSLYHTFKEGRRPHEKVWRLIDAYDSGRFWETVKLKISKHQLLPETNYINYIKTNYCNSIYSGDYIGTVLPRSQEQQQPVYHLNRFIEYIFDKLNINYYKLLAGERAALLNFGAIQFGWDNDVVDGVYKKHKGEIEAKFIDPINLYLDPAVIDYQKGRALIIEDEVSIKELEMEPRFREAIKDYLKQNNNRLPQPMDTGSYFGKRQPTSEDQIVRLLTIFYKEDGKINQVWMLEDGYILDEKKDIRPRRFPVCVLYANPPIHDPYGASTAKLILSNVLTINILDSIEATYTYASINRTKLVNRESGINIEAFSKYGNDPNKLFLVNGRPADLVHYVDLPQLHPGLPALRQRLEYAIFLITGVDLRYTGRDTGSITTTGGIEALQARLMMTDNVRLKMLEKFIKDVTHIIVDLYKEYGGQREFPIRTKTGEILETIEIDFDAIRSLDFDFTVDVGPYLPKNRARLAEAANIIMEIQAQYGINPPLITPEEWLMYQDFPQKSMILDRMQQNRYHDDTEELMADITSFSALTQQGVRPEAAVEILAEERRLKREGINKIGSAKKITKN